MVKTIEEKYLEQAKKLGVLARNMVDTVWVLDPETLKYTLISYSDENVLGFTAQEAMDLPIKERLAPDSYQLAINELLSAFDEYKTNPETKRVLEVEMYHKDGHTIWMEIVARFARETDGTIKVVGVAKDISKRKFIEKEREELIRQLRESLDEKERLLKENKILRGLLPICADCKKIRDDQGQWWPIEQYIASRTEANFTHTLCPICKERAMDQARKLNMK